MGKKIIITACEASGDLHGAHLVHELQKQDPSLSFQGLGGPRMQAAGVTILHDMTQISALGLGDVLKNYFAYRKIFYQTLDAIQKEKPDAVVVIDSPAFNIRLAKKIPSNIPVLYYISPQLWAWGKRRIHTVKKHIQKMLVILPFEKKMYDEAGIPCEYVGHPLLDTIPPSVDKQASRTHLEIKKNEKAIGLFPGSRKSEVERILPLMAKTAELLSQQIPHTKFYLTKSKNIPDSVYDQIFNRFSIHVHTPEHSFYEVTKAMDFALVTSGTATLETALLGTPFFLLYKTAWSTYFLGKNLIQVPYLGLVNLLADKLVVPEFIQNEAHPETIAHEAKFLLENQTLYQKMCADFKKVREKLGEPGASERAASAILRTLSEK